VLGAAHLLQRVGADVMVGDDQAVRRNEGSASTRIKSDAGFLEMFKPLRRRLELIFFL
jgi:hypothetical protein